MSYVESVFYAYAAGFVTVSALAVWQRWDYRRLQRDLTMAGAPIDAREPEVERSRSQ